MMEVIHHAMDAKLLQHSAITPWLTYGAIIGAPIRLAGLLAAANTYPNPMDNSGYP